MTKFLNVEVATTAASNKKDHSEDNEDETEVKWSKNYKK